MVQQPISETFTAFHLFCGSGGLALGLARAEEEYLGLRGRFETLGGVDADPEACADFTMLTGVPATPLDLFSRQDYIAFHGHEPPPEWREATAADLRKAAHHRRPDVVSSSPPCKSFSGLLPKAQAQTEKYQALTRLTLRGVQLILEAWADDLPGFILLENVPRITSRGAEFLVQIKALLTAKGYRVSDHSHDLGKVGGLAQHRRRYLLVARHPQKVATDLFQTPQRPVRPIRDVLETLPLPDDPSAGPMHRLPRLQWLTWVRLALIPAGGDWRDLQTLEPSAYRIVSPNGYYDHSYGIKAWTDPAGTVTSGGSPSNGSVSVADPRIPLGAETSSRDQAITNPRLHHAPRKGVYRIAPWDMPATTIIGSASVRGSNGVAAVSDPRLHHTPRPGSYRIGSWQSPASTITGSTQIGTSNGYGAIADPRFAQPPGQHGGAYGVLLWDHPTGTIRGVGRINNSPSAIADPRLPHLHGARFAGSPGLLGVLRWHQAATAVTSSQQVTSSNTPSAVGDPRLTCTPRSGAYRIIAWNQPTPTVTAAGDVHSQGAAAVADPRLPGDRESGAWVIIAPDGTWHRPLTTLELAALQGFPTTLPNGQPLVLAGKSHSGWRERLGNAVPPPAAEQIGRALLLALIPARANLWAWNVWGTAIWVRMVFWSRRIRQLRALVRPVSDRR